jgi:hypothetical protein
MRQVDEEITVLEAALLLELTPRAVQLMIARGDLPARRAQPWRKRSPWLIKQSDVDRLLKPDSNTTLFITSLLLFTVFIILPAI